MLHGYRWLYSLYKKEEIFETRFDTSNYKLERPLPKGKTKMLSD